MRLDIEERIGTGGFGRVYAARVLGEPQRRVVALKKARVEDNIENPMLRHEACAMLMLKGHPSIPEVHAWGRSQIFEHLAFELLGKSVIHLVYSTPGLTLRNLIALACQMTDAIQHVHSHGIVHCDIKPQNFLLGLNGRQGHVKLIDFGLARNLRNPLTQQHIREETMRSHVGTRSHMSLNIHLHHNPSRRDDMESLAYTIADLLCGGLPWSKLNSSDYFTEKQAWSGAALCAGYPEVFGKFVDYTRSLGFREEPDYETWRQRFLAADPELQGYPFYDSSKGGIVVGRRLGGATTPPAGSQQQPSSHVADKDFDWISMSTWGERFDVASEDLFDDEQAMVQQQLQIIEEPVPRYYEWETIHPF